MIKIVAKNKKTIDLMPTKTKTQKYQNNMELGLGITITMIC